MPSEGHVDNLDYILRVRTIEAREGELARCIDDDTQPQVFLIHVGARRCERNWSCPARDGDLY